MLPILVKFLGCINAAICVHCMCVHVYKIHVCITVAENDTATATQAAVGRPKAAIGRQRAANQLQLAAAAQLCPPIYYSLSYDWLTVAI